MELQKIYILNSLAKVKKQTSVNPVIKRVTEVQLFYSIFF